MNKSKFLRYTLVSIMIFVLSSSQIFGQCEVFKSEVQDIEDYMYAVNQLTDSLSLPAKKIALESNFGRARRYAQEIEKLLGMALDDAYEAVTLSEEAQDNSELCGLKEVISSTIETERFSIDARDLAQQAYESAKGAVKASNMGNLQYHVSIAHRLSRKAREMASMAAHHAEMAHYACAHNKNHGVGSD